jgi:hypothetical protein
VKKTTSQTKNTPSFNTRRFIKRRITTKRFSGADMMRFGRYLTDGRVSIRALTEWFDGPAGDRGHTKWI